MVNDARDTEVRYHVVYLYLNEKAGNKLLPILLDFRSTKLSIKSSLLFILCTN